MANASNTGVTTVPVFDKTQAENSLNPFRDLIVIHRIALRMKVVPIST